MTGGLSLDVSSGSRDGATSTDTPPSAATTAAALEACDRMLGEIGRREHLFTWLRAESGPEPGPWIVLSAYYPGNRVIVLIDPDRELRLRCAAAAPAHGLHLLALDPTELSGEVTADVALLSGRLRAAGWRPSPVPAPALPRVPAGQPAPATQRATAAARATAPGATSDGRSARRPTDSASPSQTRPAAEEEWYGMLVGVALCAIVLAEAYFAVAVVIVNGGDLVLGAGLLLDACARVIGTIAAGHEGDHDIAWATVIVGSPIVASLRSESDTEPARLASGVATVALAVTGLGLLLALL